MRRAVLTILMLLCASAGCMSHRKRALPSSPSATQSIRITPNTDVQAYVDPPTGWVAQPLKTSPKHTHQVWIAPSGATAYGVIRFSLPLPVGTDLVLWGFLREMKRTQGEAILITKEWDKNIQGLRFVADGGVYRVRVNLLVDGWTAWAVYAGTRRDQEIVQNELELAEQAREHTIVGIVGRTQN